MPVSVVWKWKADEYPQPTGSSISRSSPQEAFDEQGYLLPLNRVECGIFQSHAANEGAQVLGQRGAPGLGFPAPEQPESLTMPVDKRLRLDPRAHLRRNLRFRPPENSWRLYEPDFDFLDEFFGRFLTPNSLLSEP